MSGDREKRIMETQRITDDSIHTLDLLLQNFRDQVPIISDRYLQTCAKYFDLEAMYRPAPKSPVKEDD